MKRLPRRTIAWIVLVALAWAVHTICGRAVAGHDVIESILSMKDLWLIPAIAAVIASRLFLYLMAPGWALYIAVRTWLERRAGPRGGASGGSGPAAPQGPSP